jgi:PIN domain nuclease of toxin-antitoxin system
MARDVILLDTHVLLWWALDPEHLSAMARTTLAELEQTSGFASAISIWELSVKVKRKKLELPLHIEEFARRLERGGVITLLPVDTEIWLRSLTLPWEHADPADRVIVATALSRGVPVLTKDAAIHGFSGVQSIW